MKKCIVCGDKAPKELRNEWFCVDCHTIELAIDAALAD